MSEKKSIGEKIADLRKSLKMQQDEFADRLGVSRQALSLWETGRQVPRADKIADICSLFGINGSYFYSKEEEELTENSEDEAPMPEFTTENPSDLPVDIPKAKKKKIRLSGVFDLIFVWFWTLFGLMVSVALMIVEISPNINETTMRVWMIDWLAVAIILFVFILACVVFCTLKTIAFLREVKHEKE